MRMASELMHAGFEAVASAKGAIVEDHEKRLAFEVLVRLTRAKLSLQVKANVDDSFEFVLGPVLGVDPITALIEPNVRNHSKNHCGESSKKFRL